MENHILLNAHEGSSMYCHLEVTALDQQVQFASGFASAWFSCAWFWSPLLFKADNPM